MRLTGRAPHQRTQPRRQLMQIHRFDHVVVGANVQPADALGHRIARGQHQHRRQDTGAANGRQNVQAVLARQPQIEHAGGIGLSPQLALGRLAIAHPVNLKTKLFEPRAQAIA